MNYNRILVNKRAKGTENVYAQLMSEFEKYDPKKTTEISHDDLADWIDLQAPHLTDEEIDHLIDGADVDGDGKINYKAYANLICNKILKMDSKPLQVN